MTRDFMYPLPYLPFFTTIMSEVARANVVMQKIQVCEMTKRFVIQKKRLHTS